MLRSHTGRGRLNTQHDICPSTPARATCSQQAWGSYHATYTIVANVSQFKLEFEISNGLIPCIWCTARPDALHTSRAQREYVLRWRRLSAPTHAYAPRIIVGARVHDALHKRITRTHPRSLTALSTSMRWPAVIPCKKCIVSLGVGCPGIARALAADKHSRENCVPGHVSA